MRKHRFSVSRIGIVLLLAIGSLPVAAQQESSESPRQLTLRQAISLATDSSLASFRARHSYLSSYWQYRTYKAQNLPQLNLTSTPISYNQNFVLRYNSDTNTDEYRPQQNISSSLGLSVQQNVGPLGGTFYIESDLSFYRNFGDADQQQFSATPFRIGYYQPLFGYNQYRWDKRIEPIKYEAAKRTLLYNMEDIAQQVTDLFFALVMAQENYKMGQANLANADTLYAIGQQKYDIASISKSDLLSLKLDVVDARNALENYRLELKRAKFSLTSYLNLPEDVDIELEIPDLPVESFIDPEKALSYATTNNPQIMEFRRRELEVESAMQKAKVESRFSATLRASVGFNQAAETLGSAYRNLQRQDQVSVGLSIPIVDWGIAKGRYNIAKSNYDMEMVSIEQDRISLEQDVIMTVSEFNIQLDLAKSSLEALELARQVYRNTMERFIIGKANVTDLTSAFSRQNTAQTNYITALRNYWDSYAKIKKLTLFDFENGMSLSENFDRMYSMLTSRR